MQVLPRYSQLNELPDFEARIKCIAPREDLYYTLLGDPRFSDAMQQALAWNWAMLDKFIALQESWVACLTDLLDDPGPHDNEWFFEKYFWVYGEKKQRIAQFCDEVLSSVFPKSEKPDLHVNVRKLLNEVIRYQLDESDLEKIMIYEFHASMNDGFFVRAKAIRDTFSLRDTEIRYALLSVCRNRSKDALGYSLREQHIYPLSEIDNYLINTDDQPESLRVPIEVYVQYGLTPVDLHTIGIPSAVWQFKLIQLYLCWEPWTSRDYMIKRLIWEMIWPEKCVEALEEAYRRAVLAAGIATQTMGDDRFERLQKIAKAGEFDEVKQWQLNREGLQWALRTGELEEDIVKACAFYDIPESEIFVEA